MLSSPERALSADLRELDDLLRTVSEQIDIDHCRDVDRRYRCALTLQDVDRPPLVVKADYGASIALPEPWSRFRRYSYRETFDDPAAMLQNLILGFVVPGMLLADDSPLAIRANHGTIQVASALGAKWRLHDDNCSWVDPVDNIERIASGEGICLAGSIVPRSLDTLAFYRERLAQFPPCDEAIQISLPDLQGPIDNADLLWGSDIYYSFAENPALLRDVLSATTGAVAELARTYRPTASDRLDPVANTQQGYQIPGRLLIRNDSSIMLSPDTYAEFVRPYDARLLNEIGGGSIHFCGDGRHLVEKMLEIPDLRGLDLGQPHMMDADAIYAACRERGVAVTNLRPSRSDLTDGTAARRYPTGAVLVYSTDDLADAREVVRLYKESAR